ncbi:MAG TPA: sugar transferase [Fibrobacteria bacterium]|nr:sugar transferase [Fibrobacteria bacterium]
MVTTRQRPFREDGSEWWKGPVRPLVRVADLVSILQAAGDLGAVVLAYALASRLWPILTEFPGIAVLKENIPPGNYSVNALVTACLLGPIFHSMGLYEEQHSLLNIQEYQNILRGWFLTMLLAVLAVATIERSFQSRGIFLTVWFLLLVLLFFFRFSVYRLGIFLRQRGWRDRRILIYGAGETGKSLLRILRRSPKTGLEIAGFLDDDATLFGRTVEDAEVLGGGADMKRVLEQTGASEIFVALPRTNRSTLLRIVEQCRRNATPFRLVPSLFDIVLQQVEVLDIGGIPLIGVHTPGLSPARSAVKRAIDLGASATALFFLSPVLVVLAIAIRLVDGSPVLFSQRRVGRDGRQFRMFKFRTMRTDAATYANAPTDQRDERVTTLGRFLRRTSLDELPQLWNVLRGDMSLVGPRPEMPFLVESYDDLQRQRLAVKPGITGLWQVSPDRAEPIHAHMDYDIYYIRHQSILLDLAILLKTGSSVVRGKGAY